MRVLNDLLLKITKRAEKHDTKHLVDSFVNIGSILTVLKTQDNQIIFGRRGTGKTHVLGYLSNQISIDGRLAIQIEMNSMGSTGSIYSDPNLPIRERGTRLLVDTLICIHDKLAELAIANSEELDLSKLGPLLDKFVDSALHVSIEGKVEINTAQQMIDETISGTKGTLSLDPIQPTLSLELSGGQKSAQSSEMKSRREGREVFHVNFGAVQREFERLVQALPKSQLWIMLDEWSELPLDLQPFVADLIRRSIMPCKGVVVKIAAIEQRCKFRIPDDNVGHIGIEIGADIATSVNLDEYMVFDNNKEKAKTFFSELLFRHTKALASSEELAHVPRNSKDFASEVFTQLPVLEEFVKAAEGVPRDAINIISIAAMNNPDDKISMVDLRRAARTWYTRAKANAISANIASQNLLNWIIDNVIQHRQARAFLLQSNTKDPLIDFLYDSRILHVIKQGVSSNDNPGKRFTVYAIDYGCYDDLISTTRAPKGLFEVETDTLSGYADVPQTDYRSIRRAILDLEEYYKAEPKQPTPMSVDA